MKILVVCQHYYPEPFRVTDMCEKLVSRGHEVFVVAAIPNYPEGEFYPGYSKKERVDEALNGVHVHRVYAHPRKKGAFHRVWNYLSFPRHAKRYVKKLGPGFDLVIAYQLSPIMMAEPALTYGKKYNVPVLLYELDPWPSNLTAGGIKDSSFVYRHFARISRKIYEKSTKVLVSSRPHIAYIESLCMKHLNIEYLPQYAMDEGTYEPDFSNPEFHVLFAGNVGQALPLEIMLSAFKDAMKENPNLYLDIAGEGSALEEAKQYCVDHQVQNIAFHGWLNKADLKALSKKCKAAIVLLNHQYYSQSTVPGKVQTYLKIGLPIISADDGATKQIIEESKAGWVLPTSDQQALTEALVRISLLDQASLMELSKNGQAYYAQEMSEDHFFEHLEWVMNELVQAK